MRNAFGAVVALAIGASSLSGATGATTGAMMHGAMMMPKCTAATRPVVWYMATAKKYYLKGAGPYGKGTGRYVCRATAVAGGGKPGPSGTMGTKASGTGTSAGSSMGGAAGGSMGGSMPAAPMTMAPRPMSSSNPTTTSPGNPMGSPMPSGSMNPASGNQGNTGAPGAGGQVPNNPASSSNSTSPSPSSSPRPRP